MRSEDREERLLRELRETQAALIERISRGNTAPTNEAGGYLHVAGQVVGLDIAIALTERWLFGRGRSAEPEEENPLAQVYGVLR